MATFKVQKQFFRSFLKGTLNHPEVMKDMIWTVDSYNKISKVPSLHRYKILIWSLHTIDYSNRFSFIHQENFKCHSQIIDIYNYKKWETTKPLYKSLLKENHIYNNKNILSTKQKTILGNRSRYLNDKRWEKRNIYI